MGHRIYRNFLRLLLLFCLTAVWQPFAWAGNNTPADIATTPPTTLPAYTNEERLTQMLVVDVSEHTLDTSPALAMTFSQDVQPTADWGAFITVTAAGKGVEGEWVLAGEPRRLYFNNIQPQTTYRVQVRPGLASKNGLRLQKPVDMTVTTRDVQPAFDFAARGSILPAKLTAGLPIRVVNVPELDMEFLRVQPDKLAEVLKSVTLGDGVRQWQLEEIHAVTESVFSRRYATDAKPNARATVVIPVENIPELQTPGLYFAVMRQPGRFGDGAYRISPFVVTNLGLHVRLYAHSVEVFANALDTGKPLANVKLKLLGEKEPLELTTDAQGHASFVHRPSGNLLLTAALDQQFTFLDLREAALDLSGYSVKGTADQPLAPFVYSARDLFRPGEMLDMSVLLRDRDGHPVSANSLNVRIVRPDTKMLLEENLTASHPKLGFFTYHLLIPADAPAGAWKAEVRINKDEALLSTFGFHVEDFMPERMKLALETEDKLLTLGEKWVVAVQGDYLHGAPAGGNTFSSVRTVALNRHPLDAFKDYFFGDPADEKLVGHEDLPELQLNGAGGVFLEVPPLAGKINSPLTLGVRGSLHETGGRTVTRQLDAPFWPTQNLVGIRPLFAKDRVDGNSEAGFGLVRVTAEGQPAAGVKPLAVTLVREEEGYFWEYSGSEGWQRKAVTGGYPSVQKKIQLDGKGHANVAFAVQYGAYRLEVEDAETGLKSVYPFHAGWDWAQEGGTAAHPDPVELALDKASYRAGETAKLKITPPAAGEAIVAVEGESLLWSQRVSLPAEGMTVDIPLDASWNRHDLYVTVTAFRPANSQKKLAPSRALGVIFLPLDRNDRKLNLVIEALDKVLPEQTVRVTVASDNLAGQPAVVTLAAVDAGVLDITDFKTPDPFAFYFAQHAYGASLHDAYGKIIGDADGKPLRQHLGGDASTHQGKVLPQPGVQVVALFSGAVPFNGEGKAKIDLPIPSFDGTLRLMAMAASSERFGSAERDMKVASPVVASMAAPRFLAGGDSTSLSVGLDNTSDTEQLVELKLEADAVLDFAPVTQTLTLAKGQRKRLHFPLAAQQPLGVGKVSLAVTGKDFTAHHQVSVAVRPPYAAKQASQTRELKPGEVMELNATTLQGFMPSGLKTNLSLSATPVLPVRSALQGLSVHPYGCLEQTASSAWPYLFLEAGVAERLGLEPPTMKERHARVSSALLRLAGMQLSSGGFSLWDDDGEEAYWLTPYVTDFLLDAKEQGFVVPAWLLQRALNNLQERLQENGRYVDSRYGFSEVPEHLDLAARAYAGYVLARVKQAPLGTLQAIYDKDLGKAASGLPLVHLGLALNAMGDSKRGNDAIQKGLGLVRDDKQYLGDYGSQLRDEAAMLYLLLRHKVDVPQQTARIKQLAGLLHNRAYFSTQEQLFTFLAGLKAQEKAKEGWKAALGIAGGSVGLSGTGMVSRALNADDLQKGVSITSAGNKTLYVDVSLDGYPTAASGDSGPMDVAREWYSMSGKRVQPQDVKVGDLLLVHLLVSSKTAIHDALVVDPVPAGFELESTGLGDDESLQALQLEGMDKPVSELVDRSTPHAAFHDGRYMAALPLGAKTRHHLFYRVRAVSAGNFVVPAPTVEDQYRPELRGVGVAGGTLLVK